MRNKNGEALIGYCAGRLIEVLSRTKVDSDTSSSQISCYVNDLRTTCEALVRVCMSHTDGYNSFIGREEDEDQ